ncbi:MAG: hypothetical protein WAS33_29735 [Candidatus Promineifilaceae bacterium]
MADPILSTTNWPAVRAALDVSLNDKQLPDSIIGLDIYSGRAVREITSRVADATTLTGDSERRVIAAAVFLTAANIAPALPSIMRAESQHLSVQRKEVDWSKRAAELRQMAEEEIAELLEPDTTGAYRPTLFARAKGRRGL